MGINTLETITRTNILNLIKESTGISVEHTPRGNVEVVYFKRNKRWYREQINYGGIHDKLKVYKRLSSTDEIMNDIMWSLTHHRKTIISVNIRSGWVEYTLTKSNVKKWW